MKTKLILAAMALPALFTACSNEEFAETTSSPVSKASLIEVGENFSIAALRGETDTRSSWYNDSNEGLQFKWLPILPATGVAGNSSIVSNEVVAPEIGLCWTGEGITALSDVVYTNYKFIHNGWLAAGQTEAEFDNCDPSILNNGWLYSEATAYDPTTSDVDNNYGITFPGKSTLTTTTANFKSGVFKTENSTMFEGDYIVYYPYNGAFCKTAAIPATSPLAFSAVKEGKDGLQDPVFGNSTFAYGKVNIAKGGTQATGFGFTNLSSLLSVQLVTTNTGVSALSNIQVYKVVLYNEAGFVKSVDLSAKAIKEGKTAQDLYCGNKVTNKTIVADLATPATITATALKYYIPVLPTDVQNLKLMVYATEGGVEKVAFVSAALSTGNTKIGAGEAAVVKSTLTAADFKTNVYYAVDNSSLATAIAACSTGLSSTNKATINVIGDITLDSDQTIPAWVTVTGDALIVPEDVTLTLGDNSTMSSNVNVQGMTCCGGASNGGKLVVKSATITSDVVIEKKAADAAAAAKDATLEFAANETSNVSGTITNNGQAVVLQPVGSAKTLVNVTGVFNNNGELTIETAGSGADDTKLYVKEAGAFNNAGTTTVQGVLAIAGTATNEGEIVDKVSSQVTGNINTLGEPGDYISEVDNNGARFEAALNERPTTIVKFVGTSTVTYEMRKTITAIAPIKKYVVNTENGAKTIFIGTSGTAAAVTATIPALDVNTALDIVPGTTSGKQFKLVVSGVMNVNAPTVVSQSIRTIEVLNVGTLNVKYNTLALTIGDKVTSTIGNLNISATGNSKPTVAKFEANSITTVSNIKVDKSAKAEIVTATSTPGSVAGIVWYTVSSTGTDYWVNGIPTRK